MSIFVCNTFQNVSKQIQKKNQNSKRLYEPLSDWELWGTLSFSQLIRYVGLPSIQAMQDCCLRGETGPIERAIEQFFGPHSPSENDFVSATVGSVHPLEDLKPSLCCEPESAIFKLVDLNLEFLLNGDVNVLLTEA